MMFCSLEAWWGNSKSSDLVTPKSPAPAQVRVANQSCAEKNLQDRDFRATQGTNSAGVAGE